jgi:hypothetical protein
MNLNDAQKQQVTKWIAEGLKLADIQKRISSELELSLTYMDVRLLVDDLRLTPKDAPVATPETSVLTGKTAPTPGLPGTGGKPLTPLAGAPSEAPGKTAASMGKISVTVDNLARPGTIVSGSVTFSDGETAAWYLDQLGRLGLAPKQQGYRPSPADLQNFQQALETELSKLGI